MVLALGGDCLAALAVLRAQPGLYGPVTPDPTVSHTIAALAADACNFLIVAASAVVVTCAGPRRSATTTDPRPSPR